MTAQRLERITENKTMRYKKNRRSDFTTATVRLLRSRPIHTVGARAIARHISTSRSLVHYLPSTAPGWHQLRAVYCRNFPLAESVSPTYSLSVC
jgi:hypothetical protein